MPDDIVDAAQKAKENPVQPQTIPPWSPMGASPTNATPAEPGPEPMQTTPAKFVTVPVENTIPQAPHPDSDKMQNAGAVMDAILGAPTSYNAATTPPPAADTAPPKPTFPLGNGKPPVPIKKKRNVKGIVVTLLLLLGLFSAGAYFIAKPDTIADLRGQAVGGQVCEDAGGKCVPNSYVCTPSGTLPVQNDCGNGNKCVGEAAVCRPPSNTPTNPPPPPNPTATPRPDPDPPTPTSRYYHFTYSNVCTCTAGAAPAGDPYGSFLSLSECNAERTSCNQNISSNCTTNNGTCVPSGWTCSQNLSYTCASGYKCGISCSSVPSPTPGSGNACTPYTGPFLISDPNLSQITITQQKYNDLLTACKNSCDTSTTKVYASTFHCSGINLTQGCQDNGTTQDVSANGTYGDASISCGTIQVDFGCKNAENTWGSLGFISKSAAVACSGGGGGGNPTPTTSAGGQCTNIKIYKNGIQVDPTTLVANDATVLAVKGSNNPTKAHFRVNGGSWSETTIKNTADEFVLDFTIPAGVLDFVIEAEVFVDGVWK